MKKMPMVKRILAAAMVIAMVATSGNMDWNLIRSKADFETAENRIASGGAFVQQIVGAGSSEYGIKRLNSLQIQVTPANSDTISSARAVIYPGVTALSQTSADSAIVWSNPAVAAVANKPDSYTITFNAETEFYLGTNEPVAVKFVVSTTNGNDIDFWTLAASTTQLPASGYFDTVGFINLDKPVCSCDLTGEELTSGSVYEQYSRVESVSLDKTDVVLSVGGTDQITPTITPVVTDTFKRTATVTVTAPDGVIASATYENGKINITAGTTVGNATITFKYGGKSQDIAVHVLDITTAFKAGETPVTYGYNTTDQPEVEVYDGTTKLQEGEHYTVSYANDQAVGTTATATVTGKTGTIYANYSWTGTYEVTQLSIASDQIRDLFTTASTTGAIPVDVTTNTLSGEPVIGTLHYGTDYVFDQLVRDSVSGNTITYKTDVHGRGNYNGDITGYTFTATLSSTSTIDLSEIAYLETNGETLIYDGTQKDPGIQIYDSETDAPLALTTNDYTLTYTPAGLVNAGDVTATVTGKGNPYTGSISVDFKILSANIATAADITVADTAAYNNGAAVEPSITVTRKSDGKNLTKGVDYVLSYPNGNTSVGVSKVRITGKGNYQGYVEKEFQIKAGLSSAVVTLKDQYTAQNGGDTGYSVTYSGKAYEPSVTKVMIGTKELEPNVDFTVGYENTNVNAGTARVVLTGKGTYEGDSTYVTFTIKQLSLTDAKVKYVLTQKDYTYTGKAIEPSTAKVTAKVYANATAALKTTVELTSADYELNYEENTNVGKANVTITGKGNYTGTKTFTGVFNINAKNIADNDVLIADMSEEYTGDERKPTPTITYNNETVTQSNYSVEYSNNTEVGTNTAIATITGTNNFTGTVEKKFTITQRSMIGHVRVVMDGVDYGVISGTDVTIANPLSLEYKGGFPVYPSSVELWDGETRVYNTGTKENYKLQFTNNRNVGTAKTVITGGGNYKVEVINVNYVITKRSLGDGASPTTGISCDDYKTASAVFRAGKLNVRDKNRVSGKELLTLGTDYTVVWGDNEGTTVEEGVTYNSTAGQKKVTVAAVEGGNYTGGFVYTYEVGTDISTSNKISVQYGRVEKSESSSGTSNQLYTETTSIDVATVNTKTKNNEATFDTYYLGDQARPMITLTSSEGANIAGHYEVKYNEPNGGGYDAGSRVTVTIKAKDDDPDYYGEITLYYDVKQIKNATHLDTNVIKDPLNKHYAYTGEEVDVFPTLNYDTTNLADAIEYEGTGKTTTLTKGVDYTVSSEDSLVESGTKTVTVTFTGTDTNVGNFQGSYTSTITIDPASPSDTFVGESATKPVNAKATYNSTEHKWVYPDTLESLEYTEDIVDPFGSGKWSLYYGTTNPKRVTLGANSVTYYKNKNSDGVPTEPFAAGEGPTEPNKTYYFKITLPQNFGQDAEVYGAFTIASRTLNDGKGRCEVLTTSFGYDGQAHKPVKGTDLKVFYDDKEITDTSKYDVVVTPNNDIADNTCTDPGEYKVEVKGAAGSEFSTAVAFTYTYKIVANLNKDDSSKPIVTAIEKDSAAGNSENITGNKYLITKTTKNEKDVFVSAFDSTQIYNIYLTYGGKERAYYEGHTDSVVGTKSPYFTVTTSGLNKPGTGRITVTGDGTYFKGSLTYSVKAIGDLKDVEITGWSTGKNYAYAGEGKAVKPRNLVIKYNGAELIEGEDYSLTYSENDKIGEATLTVGTTGIANGYYTNTATATYNVLYDLNNATVNMEQEEFTYDNGNDVKKAPTSVTYTANGKTTTLTLGTDYTISYPPEYDYKNAGTTAVVINPVENRSFNTKTKTYKIVGIPIIASMVTVDSTTFDYTGEDVKPEITVKNGETTLIENTHYTVTYSSDVKNVGDKTATVKGKGNYSGTVPIDYTVTKKDISVAGSGVTVKMSPTIPYNGGEKIVLTPVTDYDVIAQIGSGEVSLTEGKDYTVSIEPNNLSSLGNGTLKVTGKGNYKGDLTAAFTVVPALLDSTDIKVITASAEYKGSEIDVNDIIKLSMNAKVSSGDPVVVPLTCGRDFTASVNGTGGTKLTNEGDYRITLTGVGNYDGTREIDFKITKRQLSADDTKYTWTLNQTGATVGQDNWPHTGQEVTPTIQLAKDLERNKELEEGKDFTVVPKRNVNSGGKDDENGPVLEVTGMGNYTGTIEVHFAIGIDIGTADVTMPQSDYTYNGGSQTPRAKSIVVSTSNNPKLTYNTDYTVEFPEDTTNVGEKTVTIKGIGDYYGTNTNGTYTINPAEATAANIVIIPKGYELDSTTNRYYTTYPGAEYIEDHGGLTPELEVYDSATKTTLRADDFELVAPGFENNKRVGTANFMIKLMGNYEPLTIEGYFDIVARSISTGSVKLEDGNGNEIDAKEWTGQEIKEADDFEIIVSDDLGNVLTKDDYSLSYTNNTAVGKEATITVTGKRNYKDTLDKTFVIYGVLSADNITIPDAFYTGKQIVPHPTVVVAGKTLEEGTDYTVTSSADDWETATEATARVLVKDQVLYRPAYVSKNFNISTNASSLHLAGFANEVIYTGRPIKQAVNVVDGAGNIVVSYPEGSTEVAYTSSNTGDTDCIAAGTITMTVPVTVYNGTTQELTATYEIKKKNINACRFSKLSNEYYTGQKLYAPVVVVDGQTELTGRRSDETPKDGVEYDYIVTYSNNIAPGVATVVVAGDGNYTGTKQMTFVIQAPRMNTLSAYGISDSQVLVRWNRSSHADGYKLTYTLNGVKKTAYTKSTSYTISGLNAATNYTVEVNAYVTIGGVVKDGIAKSVSVTTYVKTPDYILTSPSTGQAQISWSVVNNGATGYSIYRSTKASDLNKNSVDELVNYRVADVPATRTSWVNTGLTGGQTYYYRVQAYQIAADGTETYGTLSAIKSVTVK